MLNRFSHILLVSTSLSPILGAVAVNQYSLGRPLLEWLPWLATAFLLAVVCWGLLRYAAHAAQKHIMEIEEFEDKDKEVLAYLLAYLLPLAAVKDSLADVHWLTDVYVFLIILLVFAHARAFHFNPVMGLLKYHFYSIKDSDGASVLLISRTPLRRSGAEIITVQLAYDIYLHVGESDVSRLPIGSAGQN